MPERTCAARTSTDGIARAHGPDAGDGQLRVSEGMIANESPVRSIRTLGSTSGGVNAVKVETGISARLRKPLATTTLPPLSIGAALLDSTVDEQCFLRDGTLREFWENYLGC